PVPPADRLEPCHDLLVMGVSRAHQGDEDVDVQQVRRHSASASSALTSSGVITSSAGPRSSTGIPSSYLIRGFVRVACTISSDIAFPKVKSRPLAYCAAIAAASSSKEIVVLIPQIVSEYAYD